MIDPVVAIAFWAALFFGSHLVISSGAVRQRIVAAVGEQPYRGIYSIVAFATFIPLVLSFAYHKHSGAMLWDLRGVAPVRWIVWLMMLAALILFIGGFVTPNPGSIGGEASKADPGGVRGTLKITRHPGFVAFSLFGFAHMLMNGFLGDLIFFASFPALGIAGGFHQDRRKEQSLGTPYRNLVALTSFMPFAALLSGRQELSAADVPWIAVAIGVVVTALILWLHPMLFGGYPLGFAL